MTSIRQIALILSRAMPSYAILVFIYSLLIFILPVDRHAVTEYNFTSLTYHVVLFGVGLPSMLVWFAAFVGYDKLHQYADSVSQTPTGAHFKQLARGCTWLAWSLPIPAITSLILNAISNQWPSLHATDIIVSNYIYLLLPLVAFTIIGSASRGLLKDSKINYGISGSRALMLIFVAFGVLYCYFTFQHLNLGSLGTTHNPYFLPLWLTVLTITIPYLYAWFVGALAAYEINLFSKNVKGLLYRQATRLLVLGLVIVILSLISQQYILAIRPRTGHLILDIKLVLILISRIVGGAGFILVALGAIRLKRIEEV